MSNKAKPLYFQTSCHATLPSHYSGTSDTCRVPVWKKLHLYTVTVHGQNTAREFQLLVVLCFSRYFSTKLCEKWGGSSRTAAGLQSHKSTTQYPTPSTTVAAQETPYKCKYFPRRHSFSPKLKNDAENLENIDTFPSSPEVPFSCCPRLCQHWEWLQSCFLDWVA